MCTVTGNPGTWVPVPLTAAVGENTVTVTTGAQENYSIGGYEIIRVGSASGSFSFGGFMGGTTARHLRVINATAYTMGITNLDSSSSSGNQIWVPQLFAQTTTLNLACSTPSGASTGCGFDAYYDPAGAGTWVVYNIFPQPGGLPTVTALTWGSATTACGKTNAFPSQQSFSGFKRIVIKGTLTPQSSHFAGVMISKGGSCYALNMGSGSGAYYPAQWRFQYYNGSAWTNIGSNFGASSAFLGPNYIEASFGVLGSNSNIIYGQVNGTFLPTGTNAPTSDTNIDMLSGTFVIYVTTNTSTNGAGAMEVETW
jgi:hypothetical protein